MKPHQNISSFTTTFIKCLYNWKQCEAIAQSKWKLALLNLGNMYITAWILLFPQMVSLIFKVKDQNVLTWLTCTSSGVFCTYVKKIQFLYFLPKLTQASRNIFQICNIQFCKFQIVVHWNGWFVSNFSTPPLTTPINSVGKQVLHGRIYLLQYSMLLMSLHWRIYTLNKS